MKTIDERLEYAATEARQAVAHLPSRTAKLPGRPNRVARHTAQLVALVALIVVAVGGSLVLFDGDPDVASGVAEFPRLALDVDAVGADLSLVFAEDGATSPQPAQPNLLDVYGDPSAGISSGRIFVVTDFDGSDYLRNEPFNSPGVVPVSVPTGVAYLHDEGLASVILWQIEEDHGLAVTIQGVGINTATLLDVLAGIQYDETGAEVDSLPPGFTLLYSGPTRTEGERKVYIHWATPLGDGPQATATLELHQGAEAPLERGRYTITPDAGISAISETQVLAKPALRMELGDVVVFQWLQSPTVYARLIVLGFSDADGVAAALREVDDATWEQMFRNERPTDPASTETTAAPTTSSP